MKESPERFTGYNRGETRFFHRVGGRLQERVGEWARITCGEKEGA